jgi:glutamate formiminotransferase / 5-formyltetrahydrofolate cyclo-ligase
VLECVINISEGRDLAAVDRIGATAGRHLLDVHNDPHHHRSVLTVVGEDAARSVAEAAVTALDLRGHDGVHPRLGVVDVVPFVPLLGSTDDDALLARDRFARWLADAHGVPCFLYGPERSLPEVRREAFRSLAPDAGPPAPHPTAGATAVGARGPLVAYNVWVTGEDLAAARRIAGAVRRPGLRALGLQVGDRLQVSMNLVEPARVGPAAAYDLVETAAAADDGATVTGVELVGLLPEAVLRAVPASRWDELDLSLDRTVEARLEANERP